MKSKYEEILKLIEENKLLLGIADNLIHSNTEKLSNINLLNLSALYELGEIDIITFQLKSTEYSEVKNGLFSRVYDNKYLDEEEEKIFKSTVESLDSLENKLIVLTRFSKGAKLEPHLHYRHEITYLLEGECIDNYNDKEYKKGDSWEFPPLTFHSFEAKSDGYCLVIYKRVEGEKFNPDLKISILKKN